MIRHSSPSPAALASAHRRIPEGAVVVLMMLISATLSFRVFFPHLRDIAIIDESYYIDNGQQLLHGHVPKLAQNPLVAVFWASVSLPFRSSPHWLMHTCGLGRFLIFALLWGGMYAVSRAVRERVHPLTPAGFLLVIPSLTELLNNSSDGLFAALSAFALARFIAFIRSSRTSRGLQASCLLGLAACARNDGLLLLPTAALLTVVLRAGRGSRLRSLGAIVLPATAIVGGYVVLHTTLTGSLDLGVGRRSYDAFEQGEGAAYYTRYGDRNPYVEGYDAARSLYGTPEQNRYSIPSAVARNPSAFVRRVVATAGHVPAQASAAYGRGLRGAGWVLVLLMLRGACVLWRRDRLLLVVLLAWSAHLAVYLLTFYREGYFLLVYPSVFFLAALGAVALFAEPAGGRDLVGASAALVLLVAYGIVSGNALIAWPGVTFLLGTLGAWVLMRPLAHHAESLRIPLGVGLILLLFSLQVQFSRPARLTVPALPRWGCHADERAARFMAETWPPGTTVASYPAAPVALARMRYVPPHIEARWIASEVEFLAWSSERDVHVFYVDNALRVCEPRLWEVMRGLIGTRLTVVFEAEDDHESVCVLTG